MSERILLVEDEPDVRLTLAAHLELEGFTVLEAGTAAEALALLAKEKVDLVLSDIRMPGMSGVELYTKLRAQDAEVPVVLMTAFALEDQVQTAIEGGVFTVLPKPFEVDDAVHTLRNALRKPLVIVHDGQGAAPTSLAAALSRRGVRATSPANADEAERLVREKPVDVCVADLQAGADTAARVRGADASIAIVVLAQNPDATIVESLARSGVFAFLKKPVQPLELLQSIARARAGGRT